MKLLFVLLLSLFTLINSQTIVKVSSPQFGVSSIITIEGTDFNSNPTSIKINNVVCTLKSYTTTQITCGVFTSQFTPASSTYTVSITFSSGPSASSNIFKYATPSIDSHGIYNDTYYYITGLNLPPTNSLKLSVVDTQSSTIQLTATTDPTGLIVFALPRTITGGACTFTISDTVGFQYATPLETLSVDPVLSSINPNEWDPNESKSVTITGYYFGTSIKVTIGSFSINNVAVTSNGVASFNSPVGFASDKSITITTSKQYAKTFTNTFTYVAPSIKSTTQENDTIKIEPVNVGTDSSFIKVSVNQKSTEFTFENGIISLTLPSAINTGKTEITVTADTQNATSSILVQPILTNVSSIPSVGGKVTIEGLFLNDCFFKLYDNSSKLIKDMVDSKGNNLCMLSSTGTVAICITPPMTANSTFSITAIRYTDNSDTSSESKSMSISGAIYFVEPETPQPTKPTDNPSQTPSATPSTTPSNSTESSDDEVNPSISHKLLPNLFIIISLLYFII